MKKIAIIGSGVLAQHMAHYLISSSRYKISGFYDDFRVKGEITPHGSITGNLNQVEEDYKSAKFDEIIIGIGYNHLKFREALFGRFSKLIPFTTYIHPTCFVDPSCKIGDGVIALPGCIFDMNVSIADNNFFNIGCTIAHDSKIGSHNFFGPSVKLAGFVTIEQACFIGIGTTIIDNIFICRETKTGGGAVITKSIHMPGIYAGLPAKFIKQY